MILAGFGRFGHIVGRILHLRGIKATVLDLDAEQVELVRKLGIKVFYGDASRLELLRIRSLNDLFEMERHRVRHSDTGWDPPRPG